MIRKFVIFVAFSSVSHISMAQDGSTDSVPLPPLVQELVDCRTISDAGERLACYEGKVSELDRAYRSEELIITDRQSVEEAKRGLFGLEVPKLKLLGKSGNVQLDELNATIKSAYSDSRGRWTIILEDGAKWEQIESKQLSRDPRAGYAVRIRKAVLGSYLVNVDGQVAIRMRRAN